MGRKGKKGGAEKRDSDERGFGNLLAGALGGITKELRGRRRRARKAREAQLTATEPPGEPSVEPAVDDFAQAMEGVERIAASVGVVRAKAEAELPDPERVRAEDIAELAAVENFDISYSDQYIRGCCDGVSGETLRKLARGEFAVRAHLDLHGMVVEDATREVDRFISESLRRGFRCVLIITGKGRNSIGQTGILREKIPHWLARGPSARSVLAFVTARRCDGGEGALYVLLRRQAGGKGRIEIVTGGVGT